MSNRIEVFAIGTIFCFVLTISVINTFIKIITQDNTQSYFLQYFYNSQAA